MASQEYANYLHNIEQALCSGRMQAVTHAVQDVIGFADDLVVLGQDLGKILRSLYDEFNIAPMLEFIAWLGNHPAEEMAAPALAAVEKQREGLREWRRNLNEINGERLNRDLRAQVRSREIAAATNTARSILRRGSSQEGKTALARQVGVVLGSLATDHERAGQVIQAIRRDLNGAGIDESHFAALMDTYNKTYDSMSQSQGESTWNQLHTAMVVQLMRSLPGRAAGPQPTAEQEQRFYDAMHLMLAAWFADEAVCDFFDVLRVVHEFCPADPRATGPVEGIEDLAFLRMDPVDKLASVRVLRRLGQKDKLISQILAEAKHHTDGPAAEIFLAVMGGLSNERFFGHLSGALNDKRFARMNSIVIDSLGRIGDAKSLKALHEALEGHCRARLIDPPTRRQIGLCLAALGRIARHPKTTSEQRNAIVVRALKALPDDRAIGQMALRSFYTFDPASLSEETRRIGVHYIVDALWSPDSRTKLTKGNDNQRTELGFREELVDILNDMGRGSLPMVLEEAERHSMQYSGAYWALGEAFGEIADERALPFIEKMLINTFVTDDSKIPEHMREAYYDVSRSEFVPLSRDRVAHSLLYAVRKRCGEPGKRFLGEIAKAVKARRYAAPGPQSASILQEVLMEEHLREEARQRGEIEEPAAENFENVDLDALIPQETKRPREGEAIDKLVKDVQGKGLFGVKLEKRISAIQEVAARRAQEAITALCELLDSSDVILRSAAEGALAEIIRPGDSAALFRAAVFDLLESLRKASNARGNALGQFIARLDPEREPLRSILLKFVQGESDDKMKAKIAQVYKIAHERNASTAPPVEVGEGGEAASEGEGAATGAPRAVSAQDKLEIKRRYLAERRAWLAGNKKGPEPKPPEGVF